MSTLHTPKASGGHHNNAILGYDPAVFNSPQLAKPAKSILYTIDTSNNQGNPTDFFIKNNMYNATATSGMSKRITLDDISATAQKRARL